MQYFRRKQENKKSENKNIALSHTGKLKGKSNTIPDNLGTELFVKGINGEGAKRGIKGCGCVLGEISEGNTSTLVVIEREYFDLLIGEPCDLFITA